MDQFTRMALENVKYDESIHQSATLSAESVEVKEVLSVEDVKKLDLQVDAIQKNVYKGQDTYLVTIPVKKAANEIQEVVVATFKNGTSSLENVRIMYFDLTTGVLEMGFKELDGSATVSGVFNEDFELIEFKQEGELQVSGQSCLEKAWNALPWFVKAACAGICGSAFSLNPISLVACAGCLGGSALNCI
ncbi:hypothetical protein [Priestia megaterium]|uniref:hypothetical protein n=1 Tax=Priestia megaterium TaxID=1404 RepID=UPI003D2AE764